MFKGLWARWNDSIKFLKWRDFRLFLLVSLKGFVGALGLLLKHFWWFFIFAVFVDNYGFNLIPEAGIFLNFCILFLFLLALRASVERKDTEYFLKYIKSFFGVLVVFLVSFIFYELIYMIKVGILGQLGVIAGSIMFVVPLSCLFYLDAKAKIQEIANSIIRGFKALIYFFPVFFLIWILTYAVDMFSSAWSFYPLIHIPLTLLGYLVRLFILSLITNYYTKLKHGYHKLFYK